MNRVGHARGSSPAEYYLVPIDECYKLVGLIRSHWRGLSGGTEVWREIGAFFAALKKRAGFGDEARMPDLRLAIESAEVVQYAATPLLAFKVRIVNIPSEEIIHTIALRAQIQIEVTRRKYDAERTSTASRPFWRAGSMGSNLAQYVVDSRQCDGAALYRQRSGRDSSAVHI